MLKPGLCGAVAAFALAGATLAQTPASPPERWTPEQANAWYAAQPRLLGSNYLPASAVNELEMWQASSFDPRRIDREMGWAQALGMNTMRVFLHDLLWAQDPAGFKSRIDAFLTIAAKHGVKPVFVLFDSCWDPNPRLGPQRAPIPGVHNSRWVQSPGARGLTDPAQVPRLRAYVQGVVGAFARDPRILAWDVWNEPDNGDAGNYAPFEPKNKKRYVIALLPQAFAWARSQHPVQPLTSGLWRDGKWGSSGTLSKTEAIQVAESDVITFHDYGWPEQFEKRVKQLQTYGRPIICTEYMARGAGSTFDADLPIAKANNVGMINWGFVKGREQTWLPWDSWKRPYVTQKPTVWFHDVLQPDGTPYRKREAELLRAFRDGDSAPR